MLGVETTPDMPPAEGRRPLTGRGLAVALVVMLATVVVANRVVGQSDLAQAILASERYTALPRAFEAAPDDPDVAFLGDSRCIHGVASDVVADELSRALGRRVTVWNLGVPGGPPIAQLGWTGYLLDRERPPAAVVVMLSEYMFGSKLEPTMSRESIPSLWQWDDVPTAIAAGMPVEDALRGGVSDLFTAQRVRRGVLAKLFDGVAPGPPEDLGDHGYRRAGRVDAATQKARARGRAAGYHAELVDAELNEEQLGYFDATLARLTGAGVKVIVVTTPKSTPLFANLSLPVVAEAFRRVRDIAASYGVEVVAYRDTAVVDDAYFSDGDHLTREGAVRYSTLLSRRVLAPWLAPDAPRWAGRRWTDPPEPDAGCELVFDFEEVDRPPGWGFEGESFRRAPSPGAVGTQQDVTGFRGRGLLSSFSAEKGDAATGEAGSGRFTITRPELRLLVGGGKADGLGVALIVEGKLVREARGADSEALGVVSWDVRELVGQSATLHVIDHRKGDWGHILLDQVELCGEAP